MYRTPGQAQSHSHGHPQKNTHGHPSITNHQTVVVTQAIPPFNPYTYANNPHGFHYHVPQQHTNTPAHPNQHAHYSPPSNGFNR